MPWNGIIFFTRLLRCDCRATSRAGGAARAWQAGRQARTPREAGAELAPVLASLQAEVRCTCQTHAAPVRRAAPVRAPPPLPHSSTHCIVAQGCSADVESVIAFELRRTSVAIRRRLAQTAAGAPGASTAAMARAPALVGVDDNLGNSRLRLKPYGERGGSGRRPGKRARARGDSNAENQPPAPGAAGAGQPALQVAPLVLEPRQAAEKRSRAMRARVDLPAEAHLAEVERRLQLSTTGRPPRAAAEFNRTEGAMSMATGLVLEPEPARPAAGAAPRCPPVPARAAAAAAAQPRMEMVAGVGLMFPAQAQQDRSRLAVAQLVAAHLAAHAAGGAGAPAPSL